MFVGNNLERIALNILHSVVFCSISVISIFTPRSFYLAPGNHRSCIYSPLDSLSPQACSFASRSFVVPLWSACCIRPSCIHLFCMGVICYSLSGVVMYFVSFVICFNFSCIHLYRISVICFPLRRCVALTLLFIHL